MERHLTEFRNDKNELHREDGPALIEYYDEKKQYLKREIWYVNGKFKDGLSQILYTCEGNMEVELYYKNGIIHRDDGPASRRSNFKCTEITEEYYNYGILHREDGPAHITYCCITGKIMLKIYIKNGNFHREDGPALISYKYEDKYKDYYWNGELITDLVKKHPTLLKDKNLRKILL